MGAEWVKLRFQKLLLANGDVDFGAHRFAETSSEKLPLQENEGGTCANLSIPMQ